MNYAEQIAFLDVVLVVSLMVTALALATAAIAVCEMRRFRLVAAARDPLWNASEDDAQPPFTRSVVARIRQWGGT